MAAHIGVLWLLWQQGLVQRVAHAAAPLLVQIVAPAAEPTPAPPVLAAPALRAPALPALAPPAVELESTVVAVAPATPAVAATDVAVRVEPSPPAAPVVAAAPPPPTPAVQRVPASALRYRIEPPVVVPRLSRRLRESGTVLLHVVVDVQGLPREVSLRRSSGFARLDEQALSAMRQARFVPCTADGRPVECESVAPIVYELEN